MWPHSSQWAIRRNFLVWLRVTKEVYLSIKYATLQFGATQSAVPKKKKNTFDIRIIIKEVSGGVKIFMRCFALITDIIMRLHDLIWQKSLLFCNSPWQQIYASLKFTNTFFGWNCEIHSSTTIENAVLKTTMLFSYKEDQFNQI
jgi:hypothetical protein